MRQITVAAVQMVSEPWAVERNLARAQALVQEAASQGAELVVLPEVFNVGYEYTDRNFSFSEPLEGPTGTWLTEMARRLNVHLMGSFPAYIEGDCHIVAVLVAPEGRRWVYGKNHVAMWENLYFRPGTGACIADTDLGRVGIIVCWDTVFADLSRTYRQGRVDLLCLCSSPPNFALGQIRHGGRTVLDLRTMSRWQKVAAKAYDWFFEGTRLHVRNCGVPAVHAVRCGSFHSPLPYPFLFLLGFNPLDIGRVIAAGLDYTLACPMIGHSLIVERDGTVLCSLEEEESVLVAPVTAGAPDPDSLPPPPGGRTIVPDMDSQTMLLHDVLTWLGGWRYRRHKDRFLPPGREREK